MLSFLSPCTLPLLPIYLSYITGKSVSEVKENNSKEFKVNVFIHSIFFLIGVSIIYISLGLGVSYIGNILTQLMTGSVAVLLQRIAGLIMIVLGFIIGGWLIIPTLMIDQRRSFSTKSTSYLSSLLIGLGFAAGWTPCIGPIFSGILLLGVSTGSTPILLLITYVLGFSIPFLAVSFFIGKLNRLLKYTNRLMKIGGITMIIMGILLMTGKMSDFSAWLSILLEGTPFELLG